MKLHRDIGVTQKTAWFMQQHIREAFAQAGLQLFDGPIEIDHTYIGGLERTSTPANGSARTTGPQRPQWPESRTEPPPTTGFPTARWSATP